MRDTLNWMKGLLTVSIIYALILGGILGVVLVEIAFSAEQDVTVTWEYPDKPDDLAGYELRINHSTTHVNITDTTAMAWRDTVDLNDGNNTFELRAYDEGGNRSVWAPSVGHDPAPGVPTITVIVVR